MQFYTENGWTGEKYKETKDLSTTEIAKLIRKELKEKYPFLKLSVRTEYFAGGAAIDVTIKDAPFNPINPNFDNTQPTGPLNKYYTEEATKLLEEIEKIGNQYRYSDCDGMIDFFHVNFWFKVYFDYDFRDRCEKLRK